MHPYISENTFGRSRKLQNGVDAVAGFYRQFLDALPYRRQDGRAARVVPRSRAIVAVEFWQAMREGGAGLAGRYDALLGEEAECEAFWRGQGFNAGWCRALSTETVALAITLRRANAKPGAATDVLGQGGSDLTPEEAAEVEEAGGWPATLLAERVQGLAKLLLCTPSNAIDVAHRFPAILEVPTSVLVSRMSALKGIAPRADVAVMIREEPRLLLAGGDEVVLEQARQTVGLLRELLPGVNTDKVVELEPDLLFEDIRPAVSELRELWPAEAFKYTDETNPFFAEELALAIKALIGQSKAQF